MRSYNEFDKLMDMILYVFPKYLVKLNDERDKVENFRENKLLEEFIEKVDFKELREYLKNKDRYAVNEKKEDKVHLLDKHEDKDREQSKLEKEKKNRDKVRLSDKHKDKDREQSKFGKEEKDRDKVRLSDKYKDKDREQSKLGKEDKNRDKVQLSDSYKDTDKEQSKSLEKKTCTCYNDELNYIFQNLVHKKINICIEDSISGIISNAVVLSAEDSIIKLKTKDKNIMLIPMQQIVGVRSDEIVQVNFTDNFNLNTCHCHEYQGLSKYLRSCIGKNVIIRTKGDGEFKYTSKKKITSVGRSFVFLDNNMIIFFCKIVLVEKPN